MAKHESAGKTDEWYTPRWIFDALRVQFRVDAASPGPDLVPWIPAERHIQRDSLSQDWGRGPVWLNPPYGGRNAIRPWLAKLTEQGNGICLVPNRTGADWWQDAAQCASAALFVRGKIRFLRPDGTEGSSPGYGNVLLAYGADMARMLRDSKIRGFRA